ncbi:hypothetical protein TNCV_908921 [Trichonephila clavipes]|nr:hypothetical protein TNCV_908921 [Trichonephila clavipes]
MSKMGDLTYVENVDMHYMYDHANGNSIAALEMYHTQLPNQEKPDHSIFQWLHRQLCKTLSSHVTRHDVDRRSATSSPGLELRILTRVKYKMCCSLLKLPEPNEIGSAIEEIIDHARQINLEVHNDYVKELLNSHNHQLAIDELIEIHEEEQGFKVLQSIGIV